MKSYIQFFKLINKSFIILIFLLSVENVYCQKSSGFKSTLNEKEIKWLNDNKSIKILFHKSDYKPVWYFDGFNSSGISSDYLDYILKLTGLEVDTIISEWPVGLKMLENGNVDLICSVVRTENREKVMLFSAPQIFFEHYICSGESEGKIPESTNKLIGSVVATEVGFYTGEILSKKTDGIVFKYVNNCSEALIAVSKGQADYYIGNKLNIDYVLHHENLNLKTNKFADIQDYPVCFGINKSCPELKSIIDKALAYIPEPDKKIIFEKNVPLYSSNKLLLFEDEKQYLESLGELKIAFKTYREPLEFINESKEASGIIIDIVNLIFDKAHIKVKPIFYSDFDLMLKDAEKGKIDIIASLNKTPERSNYLSFSDSYLSFPYLVVGLTDNGQYRNLTNLNGKKIAVFAGYWLSDELVDALPDSELQIYKKYEDFYSALIDKKADVGITNKISFNYYRQLKKYSHIEIFFESTYNEKCSIAVNKKYDSLLPVLNRAIALTGKTTTDYIVDKWESTPPPQEYDTEIIRNVLVIISLVFLFVSIFVFFHYYRLRKELRRVKSLQNKLDSTEEEYTRVFSTMNDIYFKLDKNGFIQKLSPSVYKISGYSISDLIGKNESVFYKNLQDRDELLNHLFEKGFANDYKLDLVKADGQVIPVSVNSQVLFGPNSEMIGFEGIIRDISLSVKSKHSLARSENKLKTVINIADLGFSTYDFEHDVFLLNSSFCNIIFNKVEEMKLGKNELFNLVHPYEKNEISHGFNLLIKGEIEEFIYDCRIAAADGDFAWYSNRFVKISTLDENEDPEILGVHINITGLKNTILNLTSNQRKLEAIYNSVQILLVAIDKHLIIREVNDVVVASTGLLKEDLIGSKFSILCINSNGKNPKIKFPEEIINILNNSVKSSDNIYNYEFDSDVLNDEGVSEKKYFSLSTSVFSVDDNLQLLLGIIDITARKRSEFEAEKTRTILEENSRLKTDFISNLSYELRTPINSISGFVSLLKNKSITQEQKEKYVEIIKDSSSKLLDIVDNVIELSRAEFNELEVINAEFNVGGLIKSVQSQYYQEALQKNLYFNVEGLSDIEEVTLNSDFMKIKSVLCHLSENAIKYTYEGGICIGAKVVKNGVEIFINDTGIGIANPENLFLASSDRSIESLLMPDGDSGMGISLRLCKAYLEVIDSELKIDSIKGKGSTFSFIIKTQVNIVDIITTITAEKPPIKGVVLIVEDEDYNYNYLSQILEIEGYDYIIADDGQKAVDFVKSKTKIDIILMDIRLPGIDGIEASRQIKILRPDLPIIAQTAYSFDTDEDRLMDQYCDDYIQKPVVSKTLISKIQSLLLKESSDS